jgi:hypothetical protein
MLENYRLNIRGVSTLQCHLAVVIATIFTCVADVERQTGHPTHIVIMNLGVALTLQRAANKWGFVRDMQNCQFAAVINVRRFVVFRRLLSSSFVIPLLSPVRR